MKVEVFDTGGQLGIDEEGDLWIRRDWERLEPWSEEWRRAVAAADLAGIDKARIRAIEGTA